MWQASFLAIWEALTFLCCLYVAVSVPYNVSFAENQENINRLPEAEEGLLPVLITTVSCLCTWSVAS